ncbi:MAG: 4Fe-4S single cluster domain-containing protein [Thermaerobacter sp.]|nr:4Fe-4S single cluster domain-containing protein [Thermaerobacter sp.]
MIRIGGFLPASRANGPGLRTVLWTQGCSLDCPGCFNPGCQPADGGVGWSLSEAKRLLLDALRGKEGLTVSGGEPFQQAEGLGALLAGLRYARDFSVIVLTGYTMTELRHIPYASTVLAHADVLIAGRYVAARRRGHGLLGSANKTMHFLTDRYTEADFANLPEAEILVASDGRVVVTGINPPQLAPDAAAATW